MLVDLTVRGVVEKIALCYPEEIFAVIIASMENAVREGDRDRGPVHV